MSNRSSSSALPTPTQFIETLENRTLLAVSTGADGWTVFGPSSDTRTIYVSSSSGSDSNSGLSSDRPLKTISKAKSLIRNGSPDWLLLKRGDIFNEPIGQWKTSGRSSTEPQLIGTYGSGARPQIRSGVKEGFVTFGGNAVNNIAITGIHFIAHTYDGNNGSLATSGIRLLRQGSNYLIEDVMVQGYKDNMVIQGDGTGINGLRLRRSVVVDAYGASYAHGIYVAEGSRNITLEQNVIDRNGWKGTTFKPTIYNHNIYVKPSTSGIVVRENIISRASMSGIQLRAGGVVEGNLFVRNPLGVMAADGPATINNNIFLECTDVGTQASGVGIDVANLSSLTARNNIFANQATSTAAAVVAMQLQHSNRNADISDNTIYNWGRGIRNGSGSSITIARNHIQEPSLQHFLVDQTSSSGTIYSGNTYSGARSKPFRHVGTEKSYSAWKSNPESTAIEKKMAYVDPTRSVAKYNGTIGGSASFDAWASAVRALSKQSWNSKLTAAATSSYIRAGFATGSSSSPGTTLLTLSARADANVRDGSYASSNYGTSGSLQVSRGTTGNNRHIYLRFDISSASTIASAKLRLYGRLNDVAGRSVTTKVYGVDTTSWSETGLTWNNRPKVVTSSLTSRSVTSDSARWYEWDLTSYIKQQKSLGKKEVTLVLQNSSDSATVSFNSREAPSNKPQLVITT